MDIRLVPALKGLITGLLMTSVTLGVYYSNLPPDSPVQYVIYLIYGLGIIWTLLAFRRSSSFTGKFGELFGQGFRCFIVVTLVMVVFTFAFNRMHPEFAEESAQAYKKLQIEQKDKFPADIENELASYKKSYNTVIIYGAIFGYLIIGAGLTAAASALLMRRK